MNTTDSYADALDFDRRRDYTPHAAPRDFERDARVVGEYIGGSFLRDVARLVGLSCEAVRQTLRAYGVAIRSEGTS